MQIRPDSSVGVGPVIRRLEARISGTFPRNDHGECNSDEEDKSCETPLLHGNVAIVEEADLRQYDVLCGRNKAVFNHVGNRRFRVTISLSLERFMKAPSRKDKSVVIRSVAALVQGNGGRFLVERVQNGRCKGNDISDATKVYYELNKKQSRLKVGHALRDMALAVTRSGATSSSHQANATMTTTTTAVDTLALPDTQTRNTNDDEPIQAERRNSCDSMLSDTVFESLVQLVAESTSSDHSSVSDLLSVVGENILIGAMNKNPIPSTIVTTNGVLALDSDGDSLNPSILSWLIDESTSLVAC